MDDSSENNIVPPVDINIYDEDEDNKDELQDEEQNEQANKQMYLDALQKELENVPPPVVMKQDSFLDREFARSYQENNPKEKLILGYAENFRRQYVHLYRDRKPLLLSPNNECDVEKFVCTTLRPTQLPFKELFEWKGAAEFVSDYLEFIPLFPPHELPMRLLSPQTTLERQKGTCFEYSTLLTSLLLASGYDAYCVSGYATQETCSMDETRDKCPLILNETKVVVETPKDKVRKYQVKPPKDLTSKYIKKMEKRRVDEDSETEAKRIEQLAIDQIEREKLPVDKLQGLRAHCWVLIIAGKREVAESFFIEPLTAVDHTLTSTRYLGIESLWNKNNYWINMQDCSNGVTVGTHIIDLNYDLGDCTCWEYMLPSNDKPILQLPNVGEVEDEVADDDKVEDQIEKHLDVPPSWVLPLYISPEDFEMRCPKGKKTKIFNRAKLEQFSPYLMKDGLIMKLSIYKDFEMADLTMVKEFFKNRGDKLYERHHNHITGWICEYFNRGRVRHLKEHIYRASSPGIENNRTMLFYSKARVDGLYKHVETTDSFTQYFVDRADKLQYRHVEFGKRAKKFGPQEISTSRPILKMEEKFHRNCEIEACNDTAECTYIVSEDRIHQKFHREDDRISASTQEFQKPAQSNEKGSFIPWNPESHTSYQVNPANYSRKKVVLYQTLVSLIAKEDKCRERVRESEIEIINILTERQSEEINAELEISVYDTNRNEKAKKRRKQIEYDLEQQRLRRQVMDLDYLAPFLAQLGDPEIITRTQALQLRDDTLSDLKHRLIDKANLIQSRFEKETEVLQKKQAWYQQHQISMQKDDEDAYLNYCSEAMFRIHILELRLNRHKEMAPVKYMELEQKIRNDSRLKEFF